MKIVVPVGALGAGISRSQVRYGLGRGADAIALDAGSTDSGPSYLARGVSKVSREAVKRDLEIVVSEAIAAKVPLLIGSCGTCGTDSGVDWTHQIACEISRDLAVSPRIARLYSEQDPTQLAAMNEAGKVTPLPPHEPATNGLISSCDHIVALMGPEPYIQALRDGADIVLGGRTTDTAVLAALPLMTGAGAGAAWHAAKIAECGGQCTINPRRGGVLISVGADFFEVEPLHPDNQCTPESVSAHMLYETVDPFILTEPGGVLDVTSARYQAVSERVVRVTGSIWRPRPYTMKLEGARAGPFQTLMIIGIEDPGVLAKLDEFHDRLKAALVRRIEQIFGEEAGDYSVSLRIYGWNGTSGRPVERGRPPPHDVGVMLVITAATQDLADRMAKTVNPYFFHMPLGEGIELPSYAFPFSPAEIPRGRVYEFLLNHVVHVDNGFELVRLRMDEVVV